MPTVEVTIGGETVIVPGVYPNFLTQPVIPTGPLPTGPLVFLAAGYGGVPFAATNYADPQSLSAAMRGAPSSDFINFMFYPSSELNGTTLVTYINVAPNTQSSASLLSSGATAVINMTSVDYGTPSNLIEYSIATGSIGGKYMTLTDGYSGNVITQDNLGLPFELAYTGTATGVVYNVTSSIAGQATSFTITSPNPGESVSIDLTSQTYGTVIAVINYLNGTGYYNAIGISGLGNMASTSLDLATNIALPAPVSDVYQYVNVTATLGEIVYWISNAINSPATAVIATGITSAPAYAPVNTALGYFTGATNGVPSLSNYASGFTTALGVPGWVVFADSTNQAIRAQGTQHAIQASSVVERKWRRFVTGSAINDTATTSQTNARSLNSISTTYVAPGVQQISQTTGLLTTYDGLHVGAAVAGMMTGNPVPTPLTNKTIFGTGVEQIFSTAAKISLQDNGVMVLDFPSNTRIPTFLSDVTTWQNDNNPTNIFNQQISCRWALGYYLVNNLQQYVGTIASSYTTGVIRNTTTQILNSLIYNGSNSIGILNSWDPTTLTLNFDPATQSLIINVTVIFVGQIRFVPFTVTINPNLNISLTASNTTV